MSTNNFTEQTKELFKQTTMCWWCNRQQNNLQYCVIII